MKKLLLLSTVLLLSCSYDESEPNYKDVEKIDEQVILSLSRDGLYLEAYVDKQNLCVREHIIDSLPKFKAEDIANRTEFIEHELQIFVESQCNISYGSLDIRIDIPNPPKDFFIYPDVYEIRSILRQQNG